MSTDDTLHEDNAVKKGGDLASIILQAPEKFANGDEQIVQESLGAMKAMLDFGKSFVVNKKRCQMLAH